MAWAQCLTAAAALLAATAAPGADDILIAHYGLEVDYKAHQFALARAIYEQEAIKAAPWESARITDLIAGFLRQWERDGLKDPQLSHWLSRFQEDKEEATRAFWEEIKRGMTEAFAAGPDSIPDMLSPGQMDAL